jgi:phosphohistidine phosphatase SixA
MQTAQLVAEVYDLEEQLREEKRLSPGFGLDELREIIKNYDEDKELLLVGHEPDFSIVIGRLIGNGRVIMKKGSVACVDLTFQPSIVGELLWLATPALMGAKR